MGKSSLINAVRIIDARAMQGGETEPTSSLSSVSSMDGDRVTSGDGAGTRELGDGSDLSAEALEALLKGVREDEAEEILGMSLDDFK